MERYGVFMYVCVWRAIILTYAQREVKQSTICCCCCCFCLNSTISQLSNFMYSTTSFFQLCHPFHDRKTQFEPFLKFRNFSKHTHTTHRKKLMKLEKCSPHNPHVSMANKKLLLQLVVLVRTSKCHCKMPQM